MKTRMKHALVAILFPQSLDQKDVPLCVVVGKAMVVATEQFPPSHALLFFAIILTPPFLCKMVRVKRNVHAVDRTICFRTEEVHLKKRYMWRGGGGGVYYTRIDAKKWRENLRTAMQRASTILSAVASCSTIYVYINTRSVRLISIHSFRVIPVVQCAKVSQFCIVTQKGKKSYFQNITKTVRKMVTYGWPLWSEFMYISKVKFSDLDDEAYWRDLMSP